MNYALRVLNDNPASVDLLGLRAVATAVADVVCVNGDEPITVGLHGPWGSGKSSLLEQVRRELATRENVLVVDLNPWEFDDQDDVRGTIIGSVLDSLIDSVDESKKDRLVGLLKRISWTRATKAVARGAITMSWDFKELAEAFTPRPKDGNPSTLAGFRKEFGEVLEEVAFDRVVVLIDDLDRCLPAAVLSTLEAVKLFLAVPKMAFIVAADQEMVRDSIAAGLGETRRSSRFARDYLDKIVQVPVGVPQPTQEDAECYVALLLAHRDAAGFDLTATVAHADDRRLKGVTPYLGDVDSTHVTTNLLSHARLIVAGLAADDVVNPRRLKRFLNALEVRQFTSQASGVVLDAEALAKLFILEHRFGKQMLTLASKSPVDRARLLSDWEKWSRGEVGGTSPGDPEDQLKVFLASEPLLSTRDTDRYFVMARKLLSVRVSTALSEAAAACLELLLSEEKMKGERGGKACLQLSVEDAEAVLDELTSQLPTIGEPNRHLQAIIRAGSNGAPVELAIQAVRTRRGELTPGTAALLQGAKKFAELVSELKVDPEVPPTARDLLARSK